MRTHQISVTVENDRIQVTPDPLEMFKSDEVQWAGSNAASSPSSSTDLVRSGAVRSITRERQARSKPMTNGRFKYTVVSDEDPGLRLDPIIIINEPPTGAEGAG
jgi:hypothetical protein